jgi:hypothetical protein
MSVHFQVLENTQNTPVVIDSVTHWEDIYNVDQNSNPVDLNKGLNLYLSKIYLSQLSDGKEYLFRVCYRDQNLKWSSWSDASPFTTTGIKETQNQFKNTFLFQNYPNPFGDNTTITYQVAEQTKVVFRIYDSEHRLIDEKNLGLKTKGSYSFVYKPKNPVNGNLVLQMVTDKVSLEKKMVKMK